MRALEVRLYGRHRRESRARRRSAGRLGGWGELRRRRGWRWGCTMARAYRGRWGWGWGVRRRARQWEERDAGWVRGWWGWWDWGAWKGRAVGCGVGFLGAEEVRVRCCRCRCQAERGGSAATGGERDTRPQGRDRASGLGRVARPRSGSRGLDGGSESARTRGSIAVAGEASGITGRGELPMEEAGTAARPAQPACKKKGPTLRAVPREGGRTGGGLWG